METSNIKFDLHDKWKPGDFIHYAGAIISHEEVEAILQTIEKNSGRDWTIREKGLEFEEALSNHTGCDHVILTNSGSSALLLSILSLDLPRGSLIAIPATCFPTCYTAILYAGHIPFIIDSDPNTFNVNEEYLYQALKQYPEIKAFVLEIIAGNIPDMIQIRKACINSNTKLIVDNCDGFGGEFYNGNNYVSLEMYADIATTSFHAAHIINMGEGGAVFTCNEDYAERALQYRDWGRQSGTNDFNFETTLPRDYPQRYTFPMAGFNLKPLELQAAMGLVQLRKLDYFKKIRTKNFQYLAREFEYENLGFQLIKEYPTAKPCWLSFPVKMKIPFTRAKLVNWYQEHGIETRPIFAGNILKQPFVSKYPCRIYGSLNGANDILENGFFLPVSPRNSPEVYKYIVDVTKEFYKEK